VRRASASIATSAFSAVSSISPLRQASTKEPGSLPFALRDASTLSFKEAASRSAAGGRDPNEWRDDPPLGLVRLKGVTLEGEGEEAEPDPRITFSIAELWSLDRVEEAYQEQGYRLAGYSYHGQVGDVSLRYCFDPQRHPEMPDEDFPLGSARSLSEVAAKSGG
jgi:hypothetical protein